MDYTVLGRTGLRVSRLGIGLAEIGSELGLEGVQNVSAVLNAALDAGITFLDTSACYGISEELIGRTIAHRRDEYVLATKAGHVTGGYDGESWTPQTVRDSIDRSLRRMRTEVLDLVQLHSCGVDTLERGEVTQVLLDARQAGKVRFIGYSGDNQAAEWAVQSGIFDTLQTSFNLVDQRARYGLLTRAESQAMGIIAKRPIANGAWGAASAPSDYARRYFERAQVMAALGEIPEAPDNRILLAFGFVFAHQEVDTLIAGTRNVQHLQSNLDWVNTRLPISRAAVRALTEAFDQVGRDWEQLE